MPHPQRPPARASARTYWFRRILVLATVAAFLFGAGKAVAWVGGSTNTSGSPAPGAGPAEPTATAPAKTMKNKKNRKSGKATAPATPQATPDGPCDPADLVVEPVVGTAVGGGNVTIGLSVTSITSPACTFDIAPDSVVVRIVKGDQRVWSSQDCPDVIPDAEVVARPDEPGFAPLTWNARYSAPGCPTATKWALPGTYKVQAAAFGSEPKTAKFDLRAPKRQTIAPSPTTSPSPTAKPNDKKKR